jgi:two-component system response regulator MprA
MADESKVLIIEDDPLIVELLKLGLRSEDFDLCVATDGKTALELFRKYQPDLIILDLMLPDMDGAEVCRFIKAETDLPILVVTARGDTSDKLNLFALGADDYVVKPFDFDELLARMHALMRRYGKTRETMRMTFLDLVLRLDTREVLRGGVNIELSAKEFDLLHFFMSNPRLVLSKESILDHVWGYEYVGDNNIVEVYIGRLRQKLGEPTLIQTVRGAGYALRL